jgi:hypothetical protein
MSWLQVAGYGAWCSWELYQAPPGLLSTCRTEGGPKSDTGMAPRLPVFPRSGPTLHLDKDAPPGPWVEQASQQGTFEAQLLCVCVSYMVEIAARMIIVWVGQCLITFFYLFSWSMERIGQKGVNFAVSLSLKLAVWFWALGFWHVVMWFRRTHAIYISMRRKVSTGQLSLRGQQYTGCKCMILHVKKCQQNSWSGYGRHWSGYACSKTHVVES